MSEHSPRGAPSAVVAFWPCGSPSGAADALRAALAGSERGLPFVVAAHVAEPLAQLAAEERERVEVVETAGPTLAALLGAAGARWPSADVAVIADTVAMPEGWLARLRDAGAGDTLLAATFATDRVHPTEAASSAAAITHPAGLAADVLLPAPGGCLLRRAALELLGGVDASFSDPEAALADLAARGRELALGVALVPDPMPRRLEPRAPRATDDTTRLQARHPWLAGALRDEAALDPGPLRQALTIARIGGGSMSVTIDARSLTSGVGGTQTYVAGLVLALARDDLVRVRAVCAPNPPEDTVSAFRAAGVEVVPYEQAATGSLPRTDVVHRPQQVFSPDDLRLLQLLGERLVVSQMDLIGYRAPAYHASTEAWQAFRRVTRLALATADIAVFFSAHAQAEALQEQLISPERARRAGIGVAAIPSPDPAARPPSVPADTELLVVLGADYAHKNRPFAIALADELRTRHGWNGVLVLAGSHVAHGSSADAERTTLAERPEMAARTIDLGPVSEAEKQWLLHAACAQLVCSSYEGFGLGPLESAAAGRPCVYAAWTSLRELIDPAAARIVPWNLQASAAGAAALLHPGPERDQHLSLLRAAVAEHSWDRVVDQLLGAYTAAIESPYRAAAPRSWAELEREELLVTLERARVDLEDRVRDGLALVDAADPLLSPAEIRGLLRVTSRGWLKRPMLAPFRALGDLQPGGRSHGGPTPSHPTRHHRQM